MILRFEGELAVYYCRYSDQVKKNMSSVLGELVTMDTVLLGKTV